AKGGGLAAGSRRVADPQIGERERAHQIASFATNAQPIKRPTKHRLELSDRRGEDAVVRALPTSWRTSRGRQPGAAPRPLIRLREMWRCRCSLRLSCLR